MRQRMYDNWHYAAWAWIDVTVYDDLQLCGHIPYTAMWTQPFKALKSSSIYEIFFKQLIFVLMLCRSLFIGKVIQCRKQFSQDENISEKFCQLI